MLALRKQTQSPNPNRRDTHHHIMSSVKPRSPKTQKSIDIIYGQAYFIGNINTIPNSSVPFVCTREQTRIQNHHLATFLLKLLGKVGKLLPGFGLTGGLIW